MFAKLGITNETEIEKTVLEVNNEKVEKVNEVLNNGIGMDTDEELDKKDDEEGTEDCDGDSHLQLLDIISLMSRYIMAIFFLTGSAFIFPDARRHSRLAEPLVFILIGVLFYLIYSSIELFNKWSMGSTAIILSSFGVLAGVFWFTGSIFLFTSTYQEMVFAIFWIFGSLCNLFVISFSIVQCFLDTSSSKPLFLCISLVLSWTANLLFFAGTAHLAVMQNWSMDYNFVNNYCDLKKGTEDVAGALLSGSILYLIHSVFHTLSFFRGGIRFKVEISSST